MEVEQTKQGPEDDVVQVVVAGSKTRQTSRDSTTTTTKTNRYVH